MNQALNLHLPVVVATLWSSLSLRMCTPFCHVLQIFTALTVYTVDALYEAFHSAEYLKKGVDVTF